MGSSIGFAPVIRWQRCDKAEVVESSRAVVHSRAAVGDAVAKRRDLRIAEIRNFTSRETHNSATPGQTPLGDRVGDDGRRKRVVNGVVIDVGTTRGDTIAIVPSGVRAQGWPDSPSR